MGVDRCPEYARRNGAFHQLKGVKNSKDEITFPPKPFIT